jgi:hypothetical protein
MAIARGATFTTNPQTVLAADGNFNHTVDSGTTILLLAVALEGLEVINPVPVWDSAGVNETFTLIHANPAGIDNGDMRLSIYGIVNPTAKTAQIDLNWNGSADPSWGGAFNYNGGITTSVAAAALFISEDQNNGFTGNQSVHASGGAAGNALIWFGAGQGFDMSPMAQSAGTTFTEVVDEETGGGGTADFGVGFMELLDSAPSAITVDYGASDENASIYIQLVVAAAGGSIPVIQHHRQTIGVR